MDLEKIYNQQKLIKDGFREKLYEKEESTSTQKSLVKKEKSIKKTETDIIAELLKYYSIDFNIETINTNISNNTFLLKEGEKDLFF